MPLITCLLSGCSQAAPAGKPDALQAIRVVMDNNYPPYTFLDNNGSLQGITIDQWRLWEKKTGVKVEISAMDWGTAQRRMEAGEFDVIDTLFYNEKRAQIYDFSKAYARLDVPIFFLQSISGITDASSLHGFPVAVKSGDSAIDFLLNQGVDQILEYPSYEAIIQAAKDKKVIVFVVDKPPALYYLYKLGIYDQFNQTQPLYSGEFHRAVLKGNLHIMQTVEQGFALISQQEYDAIDEKWLGQKPVDPWIWRSLGIIGGFIGVVIVILIGWSYSLRRTVSKRTAALNRAVEELSISEKKYRQLVDNLPGLVFRCANDAHWTVLFISELICDLLGYPNSEFLNKPVSELLKLAHGIDPQDLLKSIEADLNKTGRFQVDFAIKSASGQVVWLTTHGQAVMNPAREIQWVDGVALDITERIRAESALRESEEKLRSIIESMGDLVLVFDSQERILNFYFVGDPERMYRSPLEFANKRLEEIDFPKDVVAQFKQAFEALKMGNAVQGFDYSLELADGIYWYSARIARLTDAGGQFAGVTVVIRDITARKQAEQTLHIHEKEARRLSELMASLTRISMALSLAPTTDDLFRTAVESGTRQLGFDRMGIWVLDENNPRYSFGTYGVDEQGNIRDEHHRHLAMDLSFMESKLIEGKIPVTYSSNNQLMNDNLEFVGRGERAAAALWDGQGVKGYISVDNLIHNQPIDLQQREVLSLFAQVVGQHFSIKKGEEAVRKLNAELEQRVQQRTAQLEASYAEMQSFSYSISHDLRAPLRSLNSFSQIIEEEYGSRLDEQGRDYLHRIRAAGAHLTNLIDALLKLARISRSDIQMVDVHLSRMAQEIAESLTAAQPERKATWLIPPDIQCVADPILIRVVLENLIGNAWKFSSRHATTCIELGKMHLDGETVFYIRDDGAGFDMHYASKLFSAFQRLHLSSEFEGTGIGLAIVQRIIHRHRGRIWTESAVDQGATFYFTLGNENHG